VVILDNHPAELTIHFGEPKTITDPATPKPRRHPVYDTYETEHHRVASSREEAPQQGHVDYSATMKTGVWHEVVATAACARIWRRAPSISSPTPAACSSCAGPQLDVIVTDNRW
jgi:hypothetical protein